MELTVSFLFQIIWFKFYFGCRRIHHLAPFPFQGEVLRSSLLSRYFGTNYSTMISKHASSRTSLESSAKKGPSQLVNSGPGAEMLSRAGFTLFEMQCRLDACGCSDLIIDLIMAQPNPRVFVEVLELAIALLEGGNGVIQVNDYFFVFLNLWVATLLVTLFKL